MKFVVSSTDLLNHLTSISRVISSKSALPILDNMLFNLKETRLTITASDLETTLVTWIDLENTEGMGIVAVPAMRLIDLLKEFPEQPLTFQINNDNFNIEVFSENGKFNIPGTNGEDYPELPTIAEGSNAIIMGHDALLSGISKTLFATADDELRPVMNGILVEFRPEGATFVSSDAHKLVRYKRSDVTAEIESSFILAKKPATLLKNLLPKEDFNVKVEFDSKNAIFTMTNFIVICRLIEGKYPSYNSVIPTNNSNQLVIDRLEFYNTLRRVSVFANQANNLIRLKITATQLIVSAQDVDFSISAIERINCHYEGEEMEIGFKSLFLLEILSNISTNEVCMQLADPVRAGLLLPAEKEFEEEDVLMLLMPMMINA